MSKRINFSQAYKKIGKPQESSNAKGSASAANSSLPVLNFAKHGPSNYISLSEEMITHCTREFGMLASCMENAAYPIIAEIERPTAEEITEDRDPGGFVKFQFFENVKSRNKKLEQMESNKPLLFGTIMAQLSRESKERIKRDATWDQVSRRQDPLDLWILIGATHQGSGVGVRLVDQLAAQEHYHNLRQNREESVFNFKRRYEQAVDMRENTDEPIGFEQQQEGNEGDPVPIPAPRLSDVLRARDFINKLDDSR
jgi:hypothetical protein